MATGSMRLRGVVGHPRTTAAAVRHGAVLAGVYASALAFSALLFAPVGSGVFYFAPHTGVAVGLLARRSSAPTPVDFAALLVVEAVAFSLGAASAGVWLTLAALVRAGLPFLAWALLRRARVTLPACEDAREFLLFAVLGALLPGLVPVPVRLLAGISAEAALAEAMGTALGILLAAPLAAWAGRPSLARFRTRMRPREGAVLVLIAAGIAVLAVAQSTLPVIALLGPVLLWSALRHGFAATAVLGLATASLAVSATLRGHAPSPALVGVAPTAVAAMVVRYLVVVVGMACTLAVALERERRLSRAALRRTQELEALLRALPDTVLRLDPEGRVLDFRSGGATGAGRDNGHWLGRPVREVLPQSAADALAPAAERARTRPGAAPFSYTLVIGGDQRFYEGRVSDCGDGCLLALIRDVTEQARAEDALRQRALALARSNAELQQFAYVASHDLQEPLRTVAGFCELLKRRYGDRLDEDGREFIDFAVDGARRMQSLVRDLLDLSRVATRGRPFEPVDCGALLQRVAGDFRQALAETGATLEIGPMPALRADPAQLAQLFGNLIANALKYRGPNPPHIRITSEPEADGHRFRVSDNGIGIPDEFRDQIFEAFRRLHTREEYPGNGIGLAICRKIVARHGGRIWVESRVGQGSDFYVWLPTEPQEHELVAMGDAQAETAGAG